MIFSIPASSAGMPGSPEPPPRRHAQQWERRTPGKSRHSGPWQAHLGAVVCGYRQRPPRSFTSRWQGRVTGRRRAAGCIGRAMVTVTRRRFIQQSLGAAGLLLIGPHVGPQPSPDRQAQPLQSGSDALLVNHIGFPPNSIKRCLRTGTEPLSFAVVETESGRTVHQGLMSVCKGDLGQYLSGDFSQFTQAGTFQVEAAGERSGPFHIDAGIYTVPLRKCIDYFSVQRCGGSRTGHHAPCHLDDGRRSDNGQRQDVTGGWHDACDLRKWVDATIYGMIGLSRVLELLGPSQLKRDGILDELRWGNQYFRNMQEPAGYIMNYCGGDDGNRYTDNRPATPDDRIIHVEPCDLPAQFHFIASQAAMIRLTKDSDLAYAHACEASARRCLEWCGNQRTPRSATSLSAGVIACAQLHSAVGGDRLRDMAANYARQLISLQIVQPRDAGAPVQGFFLATADSPEPSREIQHGNLPLLALCEALEHFGEHPDARSWRESLQRHTEHLAAMSERSAFGTIPFGLYVGQDPGGARRLGSYWYRWFMKPHGEYTAADWWVGINAHLASNGVGLNRAGRLLRDRRLCELAQRQFDWIVGVNPLNASTITGVGRNQPRLFVTREFEPATPLIPGGVMNGLGGSADDAVGLYSGSYHTCEYWTPMVAYTMWLMAELQTTGAHA